MAKSFTFSSLLFLFGFCCLFHEEVNADCNFNATMTCFNATYMRQRRSILQVFQMIQNISDRCSRLDVLKTCVNNMMRNCDSDNNHPMKKMWMKAVPEIDFICIEKRQELLHQGQCLSTPQIMSGAAHCQSIYDRDTHGARRRHARHSCSILYESVKCVKDLVNLNCGVEPSRIIERIIRTFLSMNDMEHNCDAEPYKADGTRISCLGCIVLSIGLLGVLLIVADSFAFF